MKEEKTLVTSVPSTCQIRSKCLSSEWMNEGAPAFSLSLMLLLPPENTPKGVSCIHSEGGVSPHMSCGLRATTTHFGESDTAPTKQLGKLRTLLRWLILAHQGERLKACKWHVTTVTRADRSHIYFRNLKFWHEQGFQSFKNMPCLFFSVDLSIRSVASKICGWGEFPHTYE